MHYGLVAEVVSLMIVINFGAMLCTDNYWGRFAPLPKNSHLENPKREKDDEIDYMKKWQKETFDRTPFMG
ncbi:hypothetical protein KM043_013614 [Ampulex compressa]|nr:hypothetical protein KM043_013614 [Ampulex compressa]